MGGGEGGGKAWEGEREERAWKGWGDYSLLF